MNEELQRQLIRQLKVLNFWISVYGAIILIVLITVVVLVWKIVNFTNDTRQQIGDLRTTVSEKLDVKSDICEGNNSLGDFLKDKTGFCNQ